MYGKFVSNWTVTELTSDVRESGRKEPIYNGHVSVVSATFHDVTTLAGDFAVFGICLYFERLVHVYGTTRCHMSDDSSLEMYIDCLESVVCLLHLGPEPRPLVALQQFRLIVHPVF
jgi:hypothetical protein